MGEPRNIHIQKLVGEPEKKRREEDRREQKRREETRREEKRRESVCVCACAWMAGRFRGVSASVTSWACIKF
jgi:hypothetical protein